MTRRSEFVEGFVFGLGLSILLEMVSDQLMGWLRSDPDTASSVVRIILIALLAIGLAYIAVRHIHHRGNDDPDDTP